MKKKKVFLSGELLGLFLAEYQHSKDTYRAYKSDLVSLLNALGWQRDVRKIETDELTSHIMRLRGGREKYSDHPTRPTLQEKLSESTVNGHIKTIKRFFNWLEDEGYIEVSPARKLKKTKLPREISREKAMKEEELDRLLDYARQRSPRDYFLLLFVADTGCRAGGIATLTTDHLYLDQRLAMVTEKGEKARYVPYGDECHAALMVWLRERPKVKHSFVITSAYSPHNPVDPSAISQVVRRACRKLKIRSLGSHSIRHRKGHQLAAAGVAITTAADLLGHDSIESTKGYFQQTWNEVMQVGRELAIPRRGEKEVD